MNDLPTLGYVTLVVKEYAEAIEYFTRVLGFKLIQDSLLDKEKRWVVVAPAGPGGTALLLARASTSEQESRVGNQTGGRVSFFLHTDDFARDYAAMRSRGVRFMESPREESYGTVAVFEDLYGNRWDLLQLRNDSKKQA